MAPSKLQLKLGLAVCTLGSLAACGNYQAPISEQGRTQQVQSVEIISSNAGNEQSRVAPQNSTPSFSSSRPEPRVQVSSSSNRPVARVSTPETSPASTGSITRRSIGEAAAPGYSTQSRPTISRAPVSSGSVVNRGTGSSLSSALNPVSHLVKAGDTLFSIAFQYNLDFRTLAMANGLNPPYTIFVGQEIDLAAQVAGAVTDSLVDAAGNVISRNAPTSATISAPSSNTTQTISRNAPVSWQWPHRGTLLQRFAENTNEGIDISGNVGDPVLAAGAGDVVYSGRGVQGTGNLIIIRHSDRYLSAYAHNSAMLVPEGQRVEAGQQIAELGVDDQGVPMLHFEIRRDGASVDPMEFLPRQ